MSKALEDLMFSRWEEVPELTRHQQELAYIGLGIAGEAGEVVDEIKKRLRTNGEQRDIHKLKLECGDLLFYLTRLFIILGWTQEEVEAALEEKLRERALINPTETVQA